MAFYYWLTPLRQALNSFTHWHVYTKVKLLGQKEGLNPTFRFCEDQDLISHENLSQITLYSAGLVVSTSCMFTLCSSLCFVPCRAENNISKEHPVISYLCICLSLCLILSLFLFSICPLSSSQSLSLSACFLWCLSCSIYECVCAEYGPVHVKNAVSCLFKARADSLTLHTSTH